MDVLFDPVNLVALLTLIILEVVLGVDNVIFIAVLSGSLPEERRKTAIRVGLILALVGRVAMVLGVSWLLSLEHGLFSVAGEEVSFSDLVLIGGGLFLVYKAVREIFVTTELKEAGHGPSKAKASFAGVVAQIVVIDMVFAVDSVLTAIGMTPEILLIIIAITVAIVVMMVYANAVAGFVERHVSLKVLALSFLVLVGVMLILEGVGSPADRTVVYAAILFALGVEYLNFRRRRNMEKKGLVGEGRDGAPDERGYLVSDAMDARRPVRRGDSTA